MCSSYDTNQVDSQSILTVTVFGDMRSNLRTNPLERIATETTMMKKRPSAQNQMVPAHTARISLTCTSCIPAGGEGSQGRSQIAQIIE